VFSEDKEIWWGRRLVVVGLGRSSRFCSRRRVNKRGGGPFRAAKLLLCRLHRWRAQDASLVQLYRKQKFYSAKVADMYV
jgi:hypothetical protein